MVDLKCIFRCDSMYYLYTITNSVNAKQYVGITNNVGRRWIEHKSGHGSKLVWQAVKKYGVENLVLDVLCEGCIEDIKQLEILLIQHLETQAPRGYNLTEGGEGATGWKHSNSTRKKMSESRKGSSNGMYGKKHTKEAKEKIRDKAYLRTPCTGRKQARKLSQNGRARSVKIDGIVYSCIQEASENLGVKSGTLRQKFSRYNRKGNWPIGWGYV